MQPQKLSIEYDYLLKVIYEGEPGVGRKTVTGCSQSDSANYEIKVLKIAEKTIKLQCWILGQETRIHHNAKVVVLMYDVTSQISFNQLYSRLDEIPEGCVKILVGNKNDLQAKKVVDDKQAHQLVENHRFAHFSLISATNQKDVEALNRKIVECALPQLKKVQDSDPDEPEELELDRVPPGRIKISRTAFALCALLVASIACGLLLFKLKRNFFQVNNRVGIL